MEQGYPLLLESRNNKRFEISSVSLDHPSELGRLERFSFNLDNPLEFYFLGAAWCEVCECVEGQFTLVHGIFHYKILKKIYFTWGYEASLPL